MSLPMTKIPGVMHKDSVAAGMAHFEGTGPDGMTCGHCEHRGYVRDDRERKTNGCAMFHKLTGGKHGRAVDVMLRACKYFQRKTENR